MKRLISIIILLIIFCNSAQGLAKTVEIPKIDAKAAMLIDLDSGKVLYKKNIYEKLSPASTTKILTAIIVLEKCDLNRVVTISKKATLEEPSKIYLKEGEKITIRNLLYSMLIGSANDSAYALAEVVSGSVENFSKLMNAKAKAIGCKSSNFVNPSGLYNKNHYTTAYDLALISRYAMKKSLFRQIVATKSYTIAATNKSKARTIQNHNKMLYQSQYYYPGCTGVKTGYTSASKHTLVASATKDNKKLLAVFLQDNTVPFYEASKLFNYGFSIPK